MALRRDLREYDNGGMSGLSDCEGTLDASNEVGYGHVLDASRPRVARMLCVRLI